MYFIKYKEQINLITYFKTFLEDRIDDYSFKGSYTVYKQFDVLFRLDETNTCFLK